MKKRKSKRNLLTAALALSMGAIFAVPAFAADTYTLTEVDASQPYTFTKSVLENGEMVQHYYKVDFKSPIDTVKVDQTDDSTKSTFSMPVYKDGSTTNEYNSVNIVTENLPTGKLDSITWSTTGSGANYVEVVLPNSTEKTKLYYTINTDAYGGNVHPTGVTLSGDIGSADEQHLFNGDGGVFNKTTSDFNIFADFVGLTKIGVDQRGAAILADTYSELGTVEGDFINNSVTAGTEGFAEGGAISIVAYSENSGTSKIDTINGNFIGNHVSTVNSTRESDDATGGAIWLYSGSKGEAEIGTINANFIGNYAEASSSNSAYGGAVYARSEDNVQHISEVNGNFIGNHVKSEGAGSSAYGGGLYVGINSVVNEINGNFISNYAENVSGAARGGAIWMRTTGDINANFIGNYVKSSSGVAYGGAIMPNDQVGNITGSFISNYAESNNTAQGGFICVGMYGEDAFTITGDAINNHVLAHESGNAYGGFVADITPYTNDVILKGNYIGNYAEAEGGYAYGGVVYNKGKKVSIVADENDVEFNGNYVKANDPAKALGGAIFNTSGTFGLYAKDGKSISFSGESIVGDALEFDSVHNDGTLEIGKAGTYTGTVNLAKVTGNGVTNVNAGTVNAKQSFEQGTLNLKGGNMNLAQGGSVGTLSAEGGALSLSAEGVVNQSGDKLEVGTLGSNPLDKFTVDFDSTNTESNMDYIEFKEGAAGTVKLSNINLLTDNADLANEAVTAYYLKGNLGGITDKTGNMSVLNAENYLYSFNRPENTKGQFGISRSDKPLELWEVVAIDNLSNPTTYTLKSNPYLITNADDSSSQKCGIGTLQTPGVEFTIKGDGTTVIDGSQNPNKKEVFVPGLYLQGDATKSQTINIEGVTMSKLDGALTIGVSTSTTLGAKIGHIIGAYDEEEGSVVAFKDNIVGGNHFAGDVNAGALSAVGTEIGTIEGDFINNSAKEYTSAGAIRLNNSTANTIEGNFKGNTNSSTSGGSGAIALYSSTIENLIGDFTDNHTTSGVGAIDNANGSKINSLVGSFYGNYGRNVGAIYNEVAFGETSSINIFAKDGKDIVFDGNFALSSTGFGAINNEDMIGLYAEAGRSITFTGVAPDELPEGVTEAFAVDDVYNEGTMNINGTLEGVNYTGTVNFNNVANEGTTNVKAGTVNFNNVAGGSGTTDIGGGTVNVFGNFVQQDVSLGATGALNLANGGTVDNLVSTSGGALSLSMPQEGFENKSGDVLTINDSFSGTLNNFAVDFDPTKAELANMDYIDRAFLGEGVTGTIKLTSINILDDNSDFPAEVYAYYLYGNWAGVTDNTTNMTVLSPQNYKYIFTRTDNAGEFKVSKESSPIELWHAVADASLVNATYTIDADEYDINNDPNHATGIGTLQGIGSFTIKGNGKTVIDGSKDDIYKTDDANVPGITLANGKNQTLNIEGVTMSKLCGAVNLGTGAHVDHIIGALDDSTGRIVAFKDNTNKDRSTYLVVNASSGITANGATINTIEGDFNNNNSSVFGWAAAIDMKNSTINSIVGDFNDNYSGTSAGAIILKEGSVINSISGDFVGNNSKSSSGAICLISTPGVNNSVINSITGDFVNNYSTMSFGGAISTALGGKIESLTGSFIANHTGAKRGGAIDNDLSSTINIIAKGDKDIVFDGNYVETEEGATGGAINNRGTVGLYAEEGRSITFTGVAPSEVPEGVTPYAIDVVNNEEILNINGNGADTYTGTVNLYTVSNKKTTTDTYTPKAITNIYGGTVNVTGDFAQNEVNLNGGTLNFGKDATITNLNANGGALGMSVDLDGFENTATGVLNVENFAGNIENFSVDYDPTAASGSNMDKMTVAAAAGGSAIKLTSVNIIKDGSVLENGTFLDGDGIGNIVDNTEEFTTTATSGGYLYTFTPISKGVVGVTQTGGRELWEEIQDPEGADTYSITTEVYQTNHDLGNLAGEERAFTISGNGNTIDATKGQADKYDGVTVGNGQTLAVENATMQNFDNVITAGEGATVLVQNTTFAGNNNDINNNGDLLLSGVNSIDTVKGTGSTAITDGITAVNKELTQDNLLVGEEAAVVVNADNLNVKNGVEDEGVMQLTGGTLNTDVYGVAGEVDIVDGPVVNNATIANDAVVVSSELTNNNTISANDVTNLGTVNNNGAIDAAAITNAGTINNNSSISAGIIDNSVGTLNMNDGSELSADVYGGTVNSNGNNTVQGDVAVDNLNFNGGILNMDGYLGARITEANGGALIMNGNGFGNADFGALTLNAPMNVMLDTNLTTMTVDQISADSVSGNGFINLFLDVPTQSSRIMNQKSFVLNPISNEFGTLSRAELAHSIYHNPQSMLTPIYNYTSSYNPMTGLVTFGGGESYEGYNSAVYTAPVAAQMGGIVNLLNSYETGFANMDLAMAMPRAERQALKARNKYAALADEANLVTYSPNQIPEENAGVWFRPYASFESVGLNGGPDVGNNNYGGLIGGDLRMMELKGWDVVLSGFAGYNGSHQHFDGNSIWQNGGMLGGTAVFYNGDFFTGLTASVGVSVADATTMYGKEDFAMLNAGIASKTGYNWELLNGKFIIQPSFLVGYSMVNTFNHHNAADIAIDSDLLQSIHLIPGLKFIGNLPHGWQPYVGVQMVWNVMDKSKFWANNASLPDTSIDPYIQYGIGVQKRWGERFTGFGQVMFRNGGRTGVSLSGGFRWALGRQISPKKANSDNSIKKTKANVNLNLSSNKQSDLALR